MTPCWANLITVDLDAIFLAQNISTNKVRKTLTSLGTYALDANARSIWNQGGFYGVGFKIDSAELIGTSMAIAPVAGVGFCTFSWPSHLDKNAVSEVNLQGEVLRRITKAADDQMMLPITYIADFIGDTDYIFEVAFRRRISYRIGFYASILKKDFNCYDRLFEATIIGNPSQLEVISNNENNLVNFSITLNLLARLNGTMAYEQHHGIPHSKSPGRVRDYSIKLSMLEARLQKLANLIKQTFNDDGRVAINALLFELENQRIAGIWNVIDSPCWGKIARSEVFSVDLTKS